MQLLDLKANHHHRPGTQDKLGGFGPARIALSGLILLCILKSSSLNAQCLTHACTGLTVNTEVTNGTVTSEENEKYSMLSAGTSITFIGNRLAFSGRGFMSRVGGESNSGYIDGYAIYQLNTSDLLSISIDAEAGIGSYQSRTSSSYTRSALRIGLKSTVLGELSFGRASDTAGYTSAGSSVMLTLTKGNFYINPKLGLVYSQDKTSGTANISMLYNSDRIQLGSRIGIQTEPKETTSSMRPYWGYIYGDIPILKNLGAVFRAGHFPTDPERGIKAGKIMTVGMRLTHLRKSRNNPHPPAGRSSTRITHSTNKQTSAAGHQVLTINVKNANEVEIRASFTSWNVVSMHQNSAGAWTIPVQLPPGLYQLAIRIDKGPWRSPPGLTISTDDFGGEVGLLVVK